MPKAEIDPARLTVRALAPDTWNAFAALAERNYRITCFFIESGYRRSLDLIAQAGGGRVEAYPHDTHGQKKSASFLYSCTRSMFEQEGFVLDRPKGKSNTVMTADVPAG